MRWSISWETLVLSFCKEVLSITLNLFFIFFKLKMTVLECSRGHGREKKAVGKVVLALVDGLRK